MKAVVYNKNAPSEKLVYSEVEKPSANDNELLIKIKSVSINAADYRSINLGSIPKHKIFGADISGVVESVGKNIQHFKLGDEVFGDLSGCGFGGFAEFASVPEKTIAIKPSNLSFEDAAALPLASVTALQALRKGNIQKGQQVLIVGSSGGVGTFAVQLAKYFGTTVTAVCSLKNAEQSKLLGAGFVIDYTKDNFLKIGKSYDLIIVVNGNYSLLGLRKILNPGGICMVVGGAVSQIMKSIFFGWILSTGSKKVRSLMAKPNRLDLEFIGKLAADGIIKPVIESRYPLEKTAEAFELVSKGHSGGKVVITVP